MIIVHRMADQLQSTIAHWFRNLIIRMKTEAVRAILHQYPKLSLSHFSQVQVEEAIVVDEYSVELAIDPTIPDMKQVYKRYIEEDAVRMRLVLSDLQGELHGLSGTIDTLGNEHFTNNDRISALEEKLSKYLKMHP